MLHAAPMLASLDSGDIVPVIAIGGGMIVAVIAIVFGSITKMVRSKHTEESRRELAAYAAEGSISPDDAERIMKAGKPKWEC